MKGIYGNLNDLNKVIILASSSKRREELLSLTGIPFEIHPVDVNEECEGEPYQRVMDIAERKALAAVRIYPDRLILSADTIVYVNGMFFGKPKNCDHAYQMLKVLSGQCHQVYTGVCITCSASGFIDIRYEKTNVFFAALSSEEIKRYISSKEPMDKAGAYAIQGRGGMFIERIEGCHTNVIGLPLALLRKMLKNYGYDNMTQGDTTYGTVYRP